MKKPIQALITIVAGAIIATSVILLVKTTKKHRKKPKIMGYTTEKDSTAIVTFPKTEFKKLDVVIVYGGISYATPKFMMDELLRSTAKTLLYSNIFIFVPYNSSWSNSTRILDEIIADYDINNISIIGFSAGGIDVQQSPLEEYRFVGLIDPSTNVESLEKNYGKNVFMVYNDSNWTGNLSSMGKTLVKLDAVIKSNGGQSEKISMAHNLLPKYFYEKYSEKINGEH